MKTVSALIIATALVAGTAAAQAPAPAAPAAPSQTPQADAAFASMDADRNGTLTREEFRAGWVALMRAQAVRATLRRQFDAVDANDDGAIDAGEYRNLQLVRQAGAQAPALAQFDANRDGKLDFAEYLELVKQLAPRFGAAADAAAARDN